MLTITLSDRDTVRDQFEDRVFADQDPTSPAAGRWSSMRQPPAGLNKAILLPGSRTERACPGPGPVSISGSSRASLRCSRFTARDKPPDSRTVVGKLSLGNYWTG